MTAHVHHPEAFESENKFRFLKQCRPGRVRLSLTELGRKRDCASWRLQEWRSQPQCYGIARHTPGCQHAGFPALGGLQKGTDFATLLGRTRQNFMGRNLTREDSTVVPSYVFAGVGGYYASKQSGLAGVFRRAADGSDWRHALSDIEAFTVFVHPRDPNLVFAGTADGVYRSTDRGQNFRRADFPDRGVQVWSFLQDDADPKWMLAGGSPVSIYRSEDGGASWKRMPEPQLPIHAKMPFSCRVMRFAPHPRRRGEIFAVLEVSGVMRSTDGGESWSDCSTDLLRLAEAEPRLRSKLVSDTEAEGMLDGHAICTSSADPDSIIIAVRMGLFRSKDQGKTWQDMRVDRFSPFTYGRDIKVSPQDPNTLYACLSVAASSKDGALYRSRDVGKTWQRFDKVTPHGTLMSVGLHQGDAKQVYVAARYGEVFGTQDGGESWLEIPLPQGVQHIYALACG